MGDRGGGTGGRSGSLPPTPHLTSPLKEAFEKVWETPRDERCPIWSAQGRLPPERTFSKVSKRGEG